MSELLLATVLSLSQDRTSFTFVKCASHPATAWKKSISHVWLIPTYKPFEAKCRIFLARDLYFSPTKKKIIDRKYFPFIVIFPVNAEKQSSPYLWFAFLFSFSNSTELSVSMLLKCLFSRGCWNILQLFPAETKRAMCRTGTRSHVVPVLMTSLQALETPPWE